MSNQPFVSVVIPSYNHQNYIEKSLNSVFQQTYSNIELIVVDDGSTDRTKEKISKIQKIHSFIFVSQENQGVCRTLNNGISMAKGQYIAILASDDYWDNTKIQKQVDCLARNEKSLFCYTQAQEFTDNKGVSGSPFPAKPYQGDVLNKVFIRQHVPAGSIMFTRSLYEDVGGFDEDLAEEDWDFVIKCASKTNFCAVVEPLLFYRSHDSNIMKTRKRTEIFQQKALLLSKNFHLVSPFRWLFSICLHFLHDIVIKK
jgi:alpha-1,3-rhamnosyltransferase